MKMQKEWKNKFERNAKINKIVFKSIYFLFAIAIIYNIIYLVNTTITKKEYLDILGIRLFCINNNLMEDEFSKNDLVIIKNTQSDKLKIGDIIAYNIDKQIKINKIINIYNDEITGKRIYITKYNKNYNPEIEKITSNQILGKKVVIVIGVGAMFRILQSKIITIFVIVILCIYFSYNKYIYENKRKRIKRCY